MRFEILFVHFLLRSKKRTKEVRERSASRLPPTRALKRRVGTQLRNLNITPFGHRHKRLCGSTDTARFLSLHREVRRTDVSRLQFLIRLGVNFKRLSADRQTFTVNSVGVGAGSQGEAYDAPF